MYLPSLLLFGPKTEVGFVFWSCIIFVLLSLGFCFWWYVLFRFRDFWCLFCFFAWFNHSMANETCSRVQMRHLKITYLTLILIRSRRWTYLYKTAKTYIGQATPSGTNDEQIADWCPEYERDELLWHTKINQLDTERLGKPCRCPSQFTSHCLIILLTERQLVFWQLVLRPASKRPVV